MLKQRSQKASASVVDGKLILSLPQASTPVLWQSDLRSLNASALQVRDAPAGKDKQTGDPSYRLCQVTKGDGEETIAEFSARAEAVQALMLATDAMTKAHGQIAATPSGDSNMRTPVSPAAFQDVRRAGWGKWLGLFAVLAGIIGFLTILNTMPRGPVASSAGGTGGQTAQNNQNSASEAGVPVSAEDFLRGR